jgi:hypothetical protein
VDDRPPDEFAGVMESPYVTDKMIREGGPDDLWVHIETMRHSAKNQNMSSARALTRLYSRLVELTPEANLSHLQDQLHAVSNSFPPLPLRAETKTQCVKTSLLTLQKPHTH